MGKVGRRDRERQRERENERERDRNRERESISPFHTLVFVRRTQNSLSVKNNNKNLFFSLLGEMYLVSKAGIQQVLQ